MTDTYLRSLGFAATAQNVRTNRTNFARAWRYQFDHAARDGATLFIEHPLGIDYCRLSELATPVAAQDIFASVGLHDRPALEAAIAAFYAAHGGMGQMLPLAAEHTLRSFRREQ